VHAHQRVVDVNDVFQMPLFVLTLIIAKNMTDRRATYRAWKVMDASIFMLYWEPVDGITAVNI
jgi:hypothetical protein